MGAMVEQIECRQSRCIAARTDWQGSDDAWFVEVPLARDQWRRVGPTKHHVCSRKVRIVVRPPGHAWDALPDQLREIRDEIERSRGLLTLGNDWDGEGSPSISEGTWLRAATFLAEHAQYLWHTRRRQMDRPDITPGPNGSIDLHWDCASYEMLVNIPRDSRELAGFYGDDREHVTLKGRFAPGKVDEGVIAWLLKVM